MKQLRVVFSAHFLELYSLNEKQKNGLAVIAQKNNCFGSGTDQPTGWAYKNLAMNRSRPYLNALAFLRHSEKSWDQR